MILKLLTSTALSISVFVNILLSDNAYSQPLSPQAQEAYQGILALAREAMGSSMSRKEFENKLLALMKGDDDDQNVAKAGAMAMFDSIELVQLLNSVESKFDYEKIFDGSRYRTKDELILQKKLLSQVNEIILTTVKSGINSIQRLEEELKKAKVTEARITTEIEAAKRRNIESKIQVEKSWEKLYAKVSLNEDRINLIDFIIKTFGTWKFQDGFKFSSAAEQDEFTRLMQIVNKQEVAFAGM